MCTTPAVSSPCVLPSLLPSSSLTSSGIDEPDVEFYLRAVRLNMLDPKDQSPLCAIGYMRGGRVPMNRSKPGSLCFIIIHIGNRYNKYFY